MTVVCQEREAPSLSFVDEAFFPGDDLPEEAPADGKLRVVVPDIGGLLPVYVLDRYEGYEVKCIPDMTPEKLERHVTLTATALRQAARNFFSLDWYTVLDDRDNWGGGAHRFGLYPVQSVSHGHFAR